jgi:FkbM family methyltransferase
MSERTPIEIIKESAMEYGDGLVPAPPVRWRTAKMVAHRLICSIAGRVAIGGVFRLTGVPFRGTWIRTPDLLSPAGPQLLFRTYERAEIDFIRRHLPRDVDVIELGASIGATSCQIARLLAPDRRMLCVEANPLLIPVLQANISRNADGRDIRIVQAMVGAFVGEGAFRQDASSLCSSAAEAGDDAVPVPATSLEALVRGFVQGSFSLVSDIEGAEALFLGNSAVLAQCRCIVLEAHPATSPEGPMTIDQVISMPLRAGGWRIVDRYGPVVVYKR